MRTIQEAHHLYVIQEGPIHLTPLKKLYIEYEVYVMSMGSSSILAVVACGSVVG
jgi:hypothetical protein